MKTKMLLLAALIITAAGCSKGHNAGPTNDDTYTKFFDNRTWSGDLKYTNRVLSETFNITFKNDGTLTWREHGGTFKGSYTLDKQTGIIRFGYMAPNAVTAHVSTDGKLENFTYNQGNWILGGTKVLGPELDLELDGSWKSDVRQEDGTELSVSFMFFPGNRVIILPTSTGGVGNEIYAKESGTIRFKYEATYAVTPGGSRSSIICTYFFVITPEKRLSGLESRQHYVDNIPTLLTFHSHLLNKQ